MKVYKPKILKNGAIGGYIKNKKGKLVWRILKGPIQNGGDYNYGHINKSLASNIGFLNLVNLVDLFYDIKEKKMRSLNSY